MIHIIKARSIIALIKSTEIGKKKKVKIGNLMIHII